MLHFVFDERRLALRRPIQCTYDAYPVEFHTSGSDACGASRLLAHLERRRDNDAFNAQKGFGFIQPGNGGKDVFVHISAVERAGPQGLHEGQKISYDVVNERGKDVAANLKA